MTPNTPGPSSSQNLKNPGVLKGNHSVGQLLKSSNRQKIHNMLESSNSGGLLRNSSSLLDSYDIQFINVCKQANVNINNEPPIIVEAVKTFVKGTLDEGWVIEEDQNGEIVYHFKPDNKTTSIHPHLNRLKTSLIYLRL